MQHQEVREHRKQDQIVIPNMANVKLYGNRLLYFYGHIVLDECLVISIVAVSRIS